MNQPAYTPLLLPFSWLYGIGTEIRNIMYDCGILSSRSFDVPVICVGNITVGGTGKTPHTEHLIRLLKDTHKIAVLSRGYKRKTKGFLVAKDGTTAAEIGDEPYQMHSKFPDVLIAVDEDRCHGIEILSNILKADKDPRKICILLDDAYQHRKVKAGLSILLADYNRPVYHDHLLPAGRLRELHKRADRADLIVITKCPANLSPTEQNAIEQQMKPAHWQQLFYSTYKYSELPENSSVLLVTGIANPKPLEDKLKELGNDVIAINYPDHYDYSPHDIERIRQQAEGRIIITTEKDAAKLQAFAVSQLPIKVVSVETSILNNQQEQFNKIIKDYADKGTW